MGEAKQPNEIMRDNWVPLHPIQVVFVLALVGVTTVGSAGIVVYEIVRGLGSGW